MLDEPLAFKGTAGVVDSNKPTPWVTATITREGLEHTSGLSLAEYREEPETLADRPQRHASEGYTRGRSARRGAWRRRPPFD